MPRARNFGEVRAGRDGQIEGNWGRLRLGLRAISTFDSTDRTHAFVPFPMGFPMGEPNNPDLQHRVIDAALQLLKRNDVPVLESFTTTQNEKSDQ